MLSLVILDAVKNFRVSVKGKEKSDSVVVSVEAGYVERTHVIVVLFVEGMAVAGDFMHLSSFIRHYSRLEFANVLAS